jgi:predicted phage tail protein
MCGHQVPNPHNYDPLKRTYTGTFNGSLSTTKQWTNNPAWVFYDLVSSERYGLGQFSTRA